MKYTFPALLLALWFGLAPSVAQADVSASNQNEAASAFQAVDALTRQTRAQGDLPRWSNPEHAKVLGRFWDVKATLGTPPYRSADVPALLPIGHRAGALYKTYVLFAPQAGTVPDTAANTAKYQDEIARAGAYLLRVQAVGLEAIADFVETLPAAQMNAARRDGLSKLRLGINEMVTGIVLMLRSPDLRSENRGLLLDALGEGAATLAASTPPADRTALIAQIDTVLPGLSAPEREKALALKAAFERKACVGLCAVEAQ
ncbi:MULTISPECIES: hypothetical protein [unclassified Beijerinckia]|uniref:hypothetical protein n=1 Tax=unclassified Beijerinckia TaxID=2638183 RepID=UPI000B89C896|nr:MULTISPECIES: hypothetical protein [unclassified Beijerinckia]